MATHIKEYKKRRPEGRIANETQLKEEDKKSKLRFSGRCLPGK